MCRKGITVHEKISLKNSIVGVSNTPDKEGRRGIRAKKIARKSLKMGKGGGTTFVPEPA